MSEKKIVTSLKPRLAKRSARKISENHQFGEKSWESFLYQDKYLKKGDESESIGYGVERCLYELNPDLACLSPLLIHAQVVTPAEALIALEEVAMQPNRPACPVDRHLAAFLMSRWKELNFIDMKDLGKPQREIKSLAVLKILAGIQGHFKVQGLPNLCQWMADLCAPIITHYHNLKSRSYVQNEVIKAVASGQLIKLVHLFASRQALMDDKSDFQFAKIEILLIESEIKEIEAKIRNRNQLSRSPKNGIWRVIYSCLIHLKNARLLYKGNKRLKQLFEKTEKLRDTWGESLVPRNKSKRQDFWMKYWDKRNRH